MGRLLRFLGMPSLASAPDTIVAGGAASPAVVPTIGTELLPWCLWWDEAVIDASVDAYRGQMREVGGKLCIVCPSHVGGSCVSTYIYTLK